MINILTDLYKTRFGVPALDVTPLSSSGSARKYYRVRGEAGHVIGTIGPDVRENETFSLLSGKFLENGCNVPEVYIMSDDHLAYLQQDLGDRSLFSLLGTEETERYVMDVMMALPQMQLASGIKDSMLYPVTRMTAQHVMADLNYFKYCFLKAVGIEADEDKLERDFRRLSDFVADTPEYLCGLLLRDCQSRNVMICNDIPYFIDFQSARRGPLLYDVASMLWQARAGFSREFRNKMACIYMDRITELRGVRTTEMEESLQAMVWIRTLQVLGAYGLRGLTQGKPHFVQSIPGALENAAELLASPLFDDLTELRRVLAEAVAMERFKRIKQDDRLTVTVFSFSYRHGYPMDMSGNGGGFMFDCRYMHNPGRYDSYKPLTGMDKPVIEFLEERGEVQAFLKSAFSLLSPAVTKYLQRGFSNLQVGFGCTGGRHRSVYCAENMAAMLRKNFSPADVLIRLVHREHNIIREI